MTAPKRIQLRTTKGWRKPEGAIVVSRPSKWGNPFGIIAESDLDLSLAFFTESAHGGWSPSLIPARWSDDKARVVYNLHKQWLKNIWRHPIEAARSELAGHDLCCWCPLDSPCHADILLELANPQEAP